MKDVTKAGIICLVSLVVVGLISYIHEAIGLSVIPNSISVDSSNRREYVYCPIDSLLLSSKTTYEINGCPIVRIYVDNWNNLSALDQASIDTQLRNAGFKDVGEVATK